MPHLTPDPAQVGTTVADLSLLARFRSPVFRMPWTTWLVAIVAFALSLTVFLDLLSPELLLALVFAIGVGLALLPLCHGVDLVSLNNCFSQQSLKR